MDFTTTAIGYTRVSTNRQEQSPEMQREKIAEYCFRMGFELTDSVNDTDVSGRTELFKRPAGEIIKDSKQSHIIVASLSRAFRNVVDGLLSLDHFISKRQSLHVIDMGQAINVKTAVGRFIFTTLLSQAELERELICERISMIAQSKKNRDIRYCNEAPYGYKWDEVMPSENEPDQYGFKHPERTMFAMVPCEQEQENIIKMKRMRKAGKSIAAIAVCFRNRRNDGNISVSLVHRLLKGDVVVEEEVSGMMTGDEV